MRFFDIFQHNYKNILNFKESDYLSIYCKLSELLLSKMQFILFSSVYRQYHFLLQFFENTLEDDIFFLQVYLTSLYSYPKILWIIKQKMEEIIRKQGRLLSGLSDLKLEVKKNITKQGDYDERRQLRKIGNIKDDGDQIIFEKFINIFRKKKPHDKKIISDSLISHFTFSYLEESIREILIEKFNFCKVDQGEYLMKQGENASCFFILHQGRMAIEIDGQLKKKMTPADGGFGQLALMFNAPRSASIKAENTCFLWYIDRKTFKTAVQEIISSTYNENKVFIDSSILLSQLTNGQRQALTDVALSQYYQKYTKICKQGQLASSFYILKTGRIRRIKDGVTVGFIEKGETFQHEIALEDEEIRKQTLITEENSHILAISISDIKKSLGKSLPIILIRNKLKNLLKKQPFFQKLSKTFASKLLDSFAVVKIDKGKTVIDTYKKQKSALIYILQGNVDIAFPKFINAKSQRIITAIKEQTKENFDKKQFFGLQALKKAASFQKNEECEYFEYNIQFMEKGKIAKSSLLQIEKNFGCSIAEAIKKSTSQKEEKKTRRSKVIEMKENTKNYHLNNFSARKVLGSGAYGKVILVTHEKQNLHFALKCISKKPLVKPKHLAFIRQQKQTLNLISLKDSPFFVKYYRSFKDDYYIYLLTQYIEGKDLFDVIRTIGILSIEQTRFYIATLIHILEVLHNQSIVYRDLKPENIMVGRDGYLKLIDMGTCKKMAQNQNKTFSFIGTPQYMAPQVFIHKGYTFTADLWSLGTICYELLAGKNPFIEIDTDDMKQIYDQIIMNSLEFPHFMKDSSHFLMKHAKSFISQLLDKNNPANRLGGSFRNLRNHPFFNGFDWDSLLHKKMPPAHYIKNQHLLSNEKILHLPSRSILTYLKDWNSEVPKIKGIAQGWDQFFSF